MTPIFLYSKQTKENVPFQDNIAKWRARSYFSSKECKALLEYVFCTEHRRRELELPNDQGKGECACIRWAGPLGEGSPATSVVQTWGRKSPQTTTSKMVHTCQSTGAPTRIQSSRYITCGELGGEGVHFFVHHLLVQSPQAERFHRERQGPRQHSVHVHASEKRHTKV